MTRSTSRFPAVSHLGVSIFRRFCSPKTPGRQKLVFWPKNTSKHTTKWAPLGPLKPSIPQSTRRVRAHIPIEQPTTVTLSVWGCLGGRSARGVQGSSAEGRPIRFVPSMLEFEHIHAKLTMTLDAPPGAAVIEKQQAWYKTYGATLCRRSLHTSSRTTTKEAPHTQCDGYGLLYGYMGTHPSRRSRYGRL